MSLALGLPYSGNNSTKKLPLLQQLNHTLTSVYRRRVYLENFLKKLGLWGFFCTELQMFRQPCLQNFVPSFHLLPTDSKPRSHICKVNVNFFHSLRIFDCDAIFGVFYPSWLIEFMISTLSKNKSQTLLQESSFCQYLLSKIFGLLTCIFFATEQRPIPPQELLAPAKVLWKSWSFVCY